MDPFSIGLMLLGSAITAKTNSDAIAKQQRLAVESQQRALAGQNQATDAAMKRVQEFEPEKRQQNQDQITQDLTQKFETAAATPITAQGVEIGKTIDGGTADYQLAKAKETAKASETNRNLAALFGRIGSAGQLRRDEAVGIGDTAGDIGRIGTGVNNVSNIDQIGINSVQPSLGGQLLGAGLSAYGMGKLSTAGLGKAPLLSGAAPTSFNGSWLVGAQ